MILTSNFRIAGHLPQAVAISRGLPKGWRGRIYKPLAPPWSLVKETDPGRFIAGYKAMVLSRLDPREVVRHLGGDNFVMLCWEAPGQFCHGRVVAAGGPVPRIHQHVVEHLVGALLQGGAQQCSGGAEWGQG